MREIMARRVIHPGEHLNDALAAVGLTPTELARRIKVPPNRITGILAGKRSISADTALRLGHYFGTSAAFWLNLQQIHDIRLTERKIGAQLKRLPRSSDRHESKAA